MKSISLIFLFIACRLAGQNTNFSHLTVNDGLSQNSILCIAQDARGFMWFGTRFGLNRYDAKRVTPYKKTGQPGSILNNYVLSLLPDSKGNLWVGTRGGLNRYLPEQDKFEEIPFDSNPSVRNKYVHCLLETPDKKIWAAVNNKIYIIDDPGKPVLRPFPLEVNPAVVRIIFRDRKDNIWVGTEKGLVKFSWQMHHYVRSRFIGDKEDPQDLRNEAVYGIVEEGDNIWIGMLNGGLYRLDQRNGNYEHFAHEKNRNSLINDHIRKLLLDGRGNLWIGTQEGISILNLNSGEFTSYSNNPLNDNSLSHNSVHSLYKDRSGAVWIGTFFGGVNSYIPLHTDFNICSNKTPLCKLNNNVISSIIEDNNGNLCIGTEGGGLNVINKQTGDVSYLTNDLHNSGSIGSNLVKTIYKDADGKIWIGTHGGGINLLQTSGNTYSFKKYAYSGSLPENPGLEISCISEDSKGLLWVGTEIKGLKPFIKRNGVFVYDSNYAAVLRPLATASINCLYETSGKKLWIGTSSGLYILDNKELQLIADTRSQYINCITEDRNHSIWIGTDNEGLLQYSLDGTRSLAYLATDGLADNNVSGILCDEQNCLWISTGNGLNKFNQQTKTFSTYNKYDGLAGNAFNYKACYKATDGKMYFGGYDGLTSFYPSSIQSNNVAPAITFSTLSVGGSPIRPSRNGILERSMEFTTRIKLNYDQNIFSVGFSVLNFIKPAKNQYAYKLEGLDNSWIYTSAPEANFANLPPGTYTLSVKGSNNDGVWSNPSSLEIIILPPFWKTWWAYVIYAILLLTAIFLITRFLYLRELYKRNTQLTQLKLNFFTNISHEIRTHLSLILGPAERLIKSSSDRPDDKAKLQTIKSNSESLLQLMNELLDFRKAETGHLPLHVSGNNLIAFTDVVYTSFLEAAAAKEIRLHFHYSKESIELWFDKEQMEKVLFNLLSNAIKFTPKNGSIDLKVEEDDNDVTLSVSNSGDGIAEESLPRLFDNYFQDSNGGQQHSGYGIGLALSRSIIDLHGGSIRVSSTPDSGVGNFITCFSIKIKKGNSHFTAEQLTTPGKSPAMQRMPEVITQQDAVNYHENGSGHPKETVLIVEDNKAIRLLIKEALQQYYITMESPDGLTGWNDALEHIPDLIISDVMMPGMDGFTLCAKLKSDIRTSHIPVILLTAKNTIENQISGLQTGADIYLTKPFSAEVLELQVRNLLASKERLQAYFREKLSPRNASGSPEQATADITDGVSMHPLDEAFIKSMIEISEANLEDPAFGVAMLSKMAAMSQPVLFKKIKAITGKTANDFVKSIRLKKACQLLLENRYTVYEIAYKIGYENSKYFSREFKKEFGCTPSEYIDRK